MKRALLAVSALLALSGCFKMQYTYGPEKAKGSEDMKEWQHRALWGVVEMSGEVDISDVCPGGEFSRVRTKVSLGNSILTMVFGTLYTPSTVQVWCADGTTYRATVAPDGEVLELEQPADQLPTPEPAPVDAAEPAAE